MTREIAIKILEYQHNNGNMEEAVRQALAMAIEALQREEAEANGYCHRIKPKGGDSE